MSTTPVRTATVVAAWLGAVVAATVVGLTAVNAFGAAIVGPGQQVLDPAEVDARLAAAPAPAAPLPETTDPAPPAPTTTTATPQPEVINSRGGSVVARCDGARLAIVSIMPAQGFSQHGGDGDDDNSGPGSGHDGRVRFESDELRIELQLSCVDGRVSSSERVDD